MKTIIKTKLHFLLAVLSMFFQVVVSGQTVSHSYTLGDNEHSIKNSFSITIDSPYQLELALEDTADGAYLSLAQTANGYNVTLVSRDASSSHHINIVGDIKDGSSQVISAYEKQFTLQQEVPTSSNAAWMSGAWGVRFGVFGGIKLDNSVTNGADYAAGVTQIENLETVDYVISNLTNNAHGYHFTLRTNPYVDIANDIHSDFVPSLENEEIIIDALTAFKAKGIKVILYIAGDGPSANGGTPDNATYKAAWKNYYENSVYVTEGPAWRALCKGFVERFNDLGLVDGFWVDHATSLPGGVTNFVNMLLSVNEDFAITVNDGKEYFNKYVGSDGTGTTNYHVINMFPTGTYSDFTTGHPTPLSTGAPPNSWAYEEYTFGAAQDEPWPVLDGKRIIRHWWGPMRQSWTGTSEPLLFDTEQAYRFVRTLTDAGGAFTWANNVINGEIPQEEYDIFQVIDQRMQQSPKPDYEAYVRPIGAYINQEVRWDGGAGTSYWSDAANWTGDAVPTATDDVVIGVGNTVLVAKDASFNDILIEEGAILNVSEQINFQINGEVRGEINYLPFIEQPAEPGIISRYRLENNANDEIGDNHGTLVGDATFSGTIIKESDYSLSLDGTGDEVDLTEHVNDFPRGGSARTITGWFNTSTTSGSIVIYGTEATSERFQIIGNNSQLNVALNGHSWGSNTLSLTTDWHHFAVVLPDVASPTSDKLRLYLDGALITSTTLAGTPKTVNTGDTFAYIGRGFNGNLDDIRFYNTALTLAEIQTVIDEAYGPILITSLEVNGEEGAINVFENNTLQMEVSVLPTNASDQSVTWSVTDGTGSATIDVNGLLTGVTSGTVTVTATSNDGSGISNQMEITVDTLIPVTSITVQGIGGATAVELGNPLQMEAIVLPENASISDVTWSTEAEGGNGTIDSDGIFTGNNDGTVYIHATATDNSGISGLISINVVTVPLVSSITINGTSGVSTVETGATLQMETTILPTNADDSSITWTVVGGTGTATINSAGLLTGVTEGTVTVVATANDGSGISAQKIITVQNSTPGVEETIYTIADAYVWNRLVNDNYGTNEKLLVRKSSDDLIRQSYVKFDLSSLSGVNTATFRLTLETSIAETRNYQAFLVSDDSWIEGGITWLSVPVTGVSLGTSTNIGQTIEWDITSAVLSEMIGNGFITIKVVSTDTGVLSNIFSKEAITDATNKPKIVINESSSGSTLSINDEIEPPLNSIRMYPNPTANIIYLKGLSNDETTIYLYNALGQLLKKEKYNSNIDLQAFEAGLYFMKILNNQQQKNFSIIKK